MEHRSQHCALNVAGLSPAGVRPERHPTWFPPSGALRPAPTLHVLNSLTETVEPFVPRDGRTVSWYVCGPTVYDSAHMGHARAYLTFDILRRVMQSYFQYNVVYQMNITDIDDKIIKRARVNALLHEYAAKAQHADLAQTEKDIAAALDAHAGRLRSKDESLRTQRAGKLTRKEVDEVEEKLKELTLQTEMFQATKARIDQILSQSVADTNNKRNALLSAASDLLGEWLDESSRSRHFSNDIFEDHARRYETQFMEDLAALNVLPPDYISRVTEYLPQITAFVQALVDKGFAYAGETSVFFDLQAYAQRGHAYPKLKPIACAADARTSAFEMGESEGVISGATGGEKRGPNDFALWKFSKPGEPAWDSPWGRGRPGWHIECSAMASEFLGANFDIHGGGWDLKFPHHDNEIAQAEAYWGNGQWVNYFLHAGHLHIKGLKMAKSLKNFSTIRETLREFSANEIRMVFLLQPWHRPMNFSSQVIGEGKEKLRVILSFLGNVEAICRDDALHRHQPLSGNEKALYEKAFETNADVYAALCDNFHTPQCMASIMELVAAGNKYLASTVNAAAPVKANTSLLRRVQTEITHPLEVFGFVGLSGASQGPAESQSTQDGVLDAFVSFRDTVRDIARAEKVKPLFAACDAVRDEQLPPLGVRLEDIAGSASRWRYQNPEEIMQEIQAKKEAAGKKKK